MNLNFKLGRIATAKPREIVFRKRYMGHDRKMTD